MATVRRLRLWGETVSDWRCFASKRIVICYGRRRPRGRSWAARLPAAVSLRSAAVAVLGSACLLRLLQERALSGGGRVRGPESDFQVEYGTLYFQKKGTLRVPQKKFSRIEIVAAHILPRPCRRLIPAAETIPRTYRPFFPRHLQRNTPLLSLPVDGRDVFLYRQMIFLAYSVRTLRESAEGYGE